MRRGKFQNVSSSNSTGGHTRALHIISPFYMMVLTNKQSFYNAREGIIMIILKRKKLSGGELATLVRQTILQKMVMEHRHGANKKGKNMSRKGQQWNVVLS
ncbi:hypothetical protein CDAR_258011 [Caerostris darwini]|uniref:Uncharacterized protein n=1 Tax=Caerostris darwini TaxID=1538125 RepID=A0AAV4WXK7_9ARAC|nr:hypothetical protein CDAR_258011 [Caerostris darwini]